jgi:6-phosphofructokinase
MQKLPDHLVGKDFPVSLSTKGGIATKTWDLTGQVLANLSGLGIEHLIAIGGDDTLSYAAKLNDLGVKIIAIPKTMDNDVRNTEYCIGFSTAITRASEPSSGSAPLSARTSESAFSASLAAMPDLRRSTPRTPPRYGASYRSTRSTSTSLIQLLLEEKRTNPSNYALVVLSEGAEWEGYKLQEYGEPDAYGTARRRAWPNRLLTRSSGASARRPSFPTSPTTCDRAIRTSSTSLWP